MGILSSAILVSLRVVGSYSNDARTTRWPFSFTPSRYYTHSTDLFVPTDSVTPSHVAPG